MSGNESLNETRADAGSEGDAPRERSGGPLKIGRREAMKWMAAAAASVSALNAESFGATTLPSGIGTDPNLLNPVVPWPRTMSEEQLRTTAALCDMIIPADGHSPSAGDVGVPDFIDEWISAPYPAQQADRERVLKGLAWLDAEAKKRFGKVFADLDEARKGQICDDICFAPEAKPGYEEAAYFFNTARNLTTGAFYTTVEGMKDIQYVGNVPMGVFPGPPPEVLKHLGLA